MKIIKHGQNARNAMKRGIDACAECTNPTLGPAGKAHFAGRIDLPPRIFDDAVSIVMNIELEDETEQAAVMLMREALMTQSKTMKDATATTMNLIHSLTKAVFEKLKVDDPLMGTSQINTVELHKEVKRVSEIVIEKLLARKRDMTKEDIYNVALSAGTYEWIAKLTAEIFEKIGKNGYVEIKEGLKTNYEILNGMDLKVGYHSEYYINNDKRECILERPLILVTNQRLDTEAIKRVIGVCLEKEKESEGKISYKSAIFIAPDFTPESLAHMAYTQNTGHFSPVALKLPTFDKDDVLIDVCTITQANLLDRKVHTSYDDLLDEITFANLGVVEKAIIGEGKTKLIGGQGEVVERIKEIKDLFDKSESPFDKENYAKRIASLAGAVAYITVGGISEQDKGYYRLKIENAVGSVQNALNGGVIQGGGVELSMVANELDDEVYKKAFYSPFTQIQKNNGKPFDVPSSVIDPVTNIVNAVRIAAGFASTLLLIESSSVFKNKKEKND